MDRTENSDTEIVRRCFVVEEGSEAMQLIDDWLSQWASSLVEYSRTPCGGYGVIYQLLGHSRILAKLPDDENASWNMDTL